MAYPIPMGKYMLLERVAAGGMAEVFKAKAFGVAGFERLLAIKRLLPGLAADEEFIDMFIDEARIAVRLSHANLVQVYELGKVDGNYYIAMEYVSGVTLQQLTRRLRRSGQLVPLPAVSYIVGSVCEGLDYAHRKTDPTGKPMNVVHRDVSPQNVLLSYEGVAKVADFGIAKAEDRASRTRAGVLKGKFTYMSPEQSTSSAEVDSRSDIFAVGILLYELVTGHHPFEGASDYETLKNVRRAELTPPTRHTPDLPDALAEIIVSTLARDPDERPNTAAEVSEALQRWMLRDATVYGAKKLSELLTVHFADEIRAETESLEEYMRWRPPPATIQENEQSAAVHHAAGANLMITGQVQSDNRRAPTQVFVSDFLAVTEGGPIDASKMSSRREDGAEVTRTSHRSPAPPLDRSELTWAAVVKGFHHEVDKAGHWAYVAGGAILVVLIALTRMIFGGAETEVVVITSKPSTGISLYLDDELIGNATPLVLDEVSEGEHYLVVTGEAFAEVRYLFELVRGSPALIHVDLELDGGLEILSPPEPEPVVPEATPEPEPEPVIDDPPVIEAHADPRPAVPVADAPPSKPVPRVSRQSAFKPKRQASKKRSSSSRRGGGARPAASSKPQPVKPCTGSGARLSLMALGGDRCKVIVNDKKLGKAPIFKKDVPIGTCTIVVACRDGRTYMTQRTFKAGEHQQLIIEPDQLR